MEVISLCPLPVAGLLWNTEHRGWSLTIICKATYKLAPGALELAREQLPLNRTDKHYDDEPMCSVRAPADLAPFKPRIDVVAVGHAHAASKTAQAVTARLEVGDLNKTVRVYGARTRDEEGNKGPTAKFKKIPLRYERATGGPGTVNPVGVPPDGTPEPDGSAALPNLERQGVEGDVFAAFGPIASAWPSRRKKLGRHADDFSIGSWWEDPFPAELDLSFFNCAPEEQQLDALKPGDTVRLQHMHGEHHSLEVELPALAPQAFLEIADGEDEILNMRCDTVWIDTDEDLLTLTWRGHLRIDGPDLRARCLVAASSDGSALSKDDIQPLIEDAEIGEIKGPPSLGAAIGLEGEGGKSKPQVRRGRLLQVMRLEVGPPSSETMEALELDPDAAPMSEIPPSMLTTGDVMLISSDQLESIPPTSSDEGESNGPRIVKLVWVDGARVRAIRDGWRELLVADGEQDDGSTQKELRDVHRVFVSAYPSSASDIEAAVSEAVGRQQQFRSPLVLTAGDLQISYDELAILRATLTAASPFAAGQYELEQLLTAARNMLSAEWMGTADGVAAELTLRILDTFSTATRGLPPGYLEAQASRIVVSERCFQRRELWGRRWIRTTFTPVHSSTPFTAYLPDEVGSYLPLFEQFFTRVIAHVDLREDQFEAHSLALKVCAIARVVDAPNDLSER